MRLRERERESGIDAMVFANRFVYVANANMPRARSTRDLPVVLLWSAHIESQPSSSFLLSFFFFRSSLSTYCYTMGDDGKKRKGGRWDNPSGNAVRSCDTVPLDWRPFYLVLRSRKMEGGRGEREREVCPSCRGNVKRRVVFHGDV